MQTKDLQLKRALRTALFILLLCLAGMTKMQAQTVQHINYGITSTDPPEVWVMGVDVSFYGNMLTISVPSSVIINMKTYTVVGINTSAFSPMTQVRSASIPSTVRNVGGFVNCAELRTVNVNSNVDFSISGFSGCSKLTSVNISHPNHLISINGSAFSGCTDLTSSSISLSNATNLSKIYGYAFSGCSKLNSIDIPVNVTMIYKGAFNNCSLLHNLSYNARNCTTVIAPSELSTFNPNEHWLKNTPIHNLSIGSQVQSIPDFTFYDCNTLTSITVHAVNPPTLGNNVFYNVNKNIPVTVPCGSANAYRNAAGWSEFTNIQESSYEISVEVNPSEGGMVTGAGIYCSESSCTLTATANSGYTFTNWTENGIVVSTDASYSFTVTGDRNLVANFSLAYNIIAMANPETGGTITGTGVYCSGSNCILTATANDGYTFTNWMENNEVVSNEASYSFTVTDNRNLVANFSINNYSISVLANPTIGGSVTGGGTYEYGTSCTIIATTNSGYLFINWTENGEIVSANANYTFIVTEDRNLVANFVEATPSSLTAGLMAYYPFDGTANDCSGNGYHAVPQNNYQFENGMFNSAIEVVGEGDNVGSGGHILLPEYSFDVSSGITLSLWVNSCGLTNNDGETYISFGNDTEPDFIEGRGVFIMQTPDTIRFVYHASEITVPYDNAYTGNWILCTLTCSQDGKLKAYINGENVGEENVDYTGQWDTSLAALGRHWWAEGAGTSTRFIGSFDDVRIYNRPLSLQEVQTLFGIHYNINVVANPTYGGTMGGGGTYNAAVICTLTATSNEGYTFINWTENDTVVSTDDVYSFIIMANRTLVANFSYVGIEGMLNGMFSVSDNKKVCFSQGNLQYQASTDTWRFATNQYDYIGEGNANISQTYDGWIDLFGWGTSGWDNGNTYYHPWDSNYGDHTLYGPSPDVCSLVGDYANADWGVYNPISNGGNQANQWRTLTYWEYNYLLDTRTTLSGIRYAKAEVNGVNGLILVPDNWDSDVYELQNVNTSESSYDSNVISLPIWINTFEANGAVFLPAAGNRFYGTSLYYLNSRGGYWLSTGNTNTGCASAVWFSNEGGGTGAGYRATGYSVRLVRDVITQTINLSQGWNWFSLYVEVEDPIEMLQTLEAALGENATEIQASEIFTEYVGGEWWGDLDEIGITNDQTYMIYVTNDCTVQLQGMPANPASHAIEIKPGWNWIGFPSAVAMDINEAFANFEAEVGDMIQASTIFTEFDGEEWFGDIAILIPGQGYMYYSNSSETKILVFPMNAR